MDYLDLSPCPTDETCVSVSHDADYLPAMKAEVSRFVALMNQAFPVPEGSTAYIIRKSFPHDFGTYYEAVARYDDNDPRAEAWAFWVEGNIPATWAALEALAENPAPMPFTPDPDQDDNDRAEEMRAERAAEAAYFGIGA